MDNLEDKLGSILGNPEMMQKIMAMAQNLGGATEQPSQEPPPVQEMPSIDPAMLQTLTGLMGNTNIDREQRALLSALSPYLSRGRIHKLENAMRASRLAGFAAQTLLRKGG